MKEGRKEIRFKGRKRSKGGKKERNKEMEEGRKLGLRVGRSKEVKKKLEMLERKCWIGKEL